MQEKIVWTIQESMQPASSRSRWAKLETSPSFRPSLRGKSHAKKQGLIRSMLVFAGVGEGVVVWRRIEDDFFVRLGNQ
jgi:hypothetical protein